MLAKCQTVQYRILEEFKADIQNIVHNVVIYHGAHSNMADQARQMFRDCVYDITELTTCRDCYRYANTRSLTLRQENMMVVYCLTNSYLQGRQTLVRETLSAPP